MLSFAEVRSWLEPLQQMLDAQEARLRALKSTTADDFLIVVAIKRQLGTLKRYLKISTTTRDAIRLCALEPFGLARKPRPREFVVLVGEFRDRSLARDVAPGGGPT
jgi:hypothetical protein